MKNFRQGFTLIELLVSLAIIALLMGMMAPTIGKIRAKADTTKCLNNLRQIGVSVSLYAADNDNRFPAIESMPSAPVYTSATTDGELPKPMFEVLSPYGVTKETLRCPSDASGKNYFAREGSSYQWRNLVDDEKAAAVQIYGRWGIRVPRSAWITIATDYDGTNGHFNRLYADGHVKSK